MIKYIRQRFINGTLMEEVLRENYNARDNALGKWRFYIKLYKIIDLVTVLHGKLQMSTIFHDFYDKIGQIFFFLLFKNEKLYNSKLHSSFSINFFR